MSLLYGIALQRHKNPTGDGLLITHKHVYFGAVSVTERSEAAPRRSLKWIVAYRIGSVGATLRGSRC